MNWEQVARPGPVSLSIIEAYAQERWPYRERVSPMVVEYPRREIAPDLPSVDPADPAVAELLANLARWPDGDAAVRSITDRFWPIDKPELRGAMGCCCGSDPPTLTAPYTAIHSTIFDTVGGAEGMVHETGHQRLRALGIELEVHNGMLLANQPAEVYASPVRKDKLRPMSAVLHAQYSYVWVTALDVALGDVAHVAINLPRIIEGHHTLMAHARWTADGIRFWAGLGAWTEEVINEARRMHQSGAPAMR